MLNMLNSFHLTPMVDDSELLGCDLGPLEPIPLSREDATFTGVSSQLFDAINQVLEMTDLEDLEDLEDLPEQLEPLPLLPCQTNTNSYAFQPPDAIVPEVGRETAIKPDFFSSLVGNLQTTSKQETSVHEELTGKDEGSAAPTLITADQSDRWNERFQELCQFRREYEYCCVPSHWPKNRPLALWVKRQRYQYRIKNAGQRSTMTEDREKLLEQLGFVWDSRSAFWEERLNELHAYRDMHGHCNVPTKYPENPKLTVWAKCQRRQFKLFCTEGSKRSNMTLERISKLARVGFVFNPRKAKRQIPKAA
jgi:hypothetical protein